MSSGARCRKYRRRTATRCRIRSTLSIEAGGRRQSQLGDPAVRAAPLPRCSIEVGALARASIPACRRSQSDSRSRILPCDPFSLIVPPSSRRLWRRLRATRPRPRDIDPPRYGVLERYYGANATGPDAGFAARQGRGWPLGSGGWERRPPSAAAATLCAAEGSRHDKSGGIRIRLQPIGECEHFPLGQVLGWCGGRACARYSSHSTPTGSLLQ
jgi:hypothetical protein